MLKKIVDDLFQNNKHYQKTTARASDFIEPLGYNVTNQLDPRSSNKKHKSTSSALKRRVVEFPQNIFAKITFNKKGPENEQDFCIREVGRKNQIAGGDNLKEYKDKEDAILENRQLVKYFESEEEEVLKYIELFQYIARDNLFAIRDFALSEYFYICQCSNIHLRKYLQQYFNHEIIQYKVTPHYLKSTLTQQQPNIPLIDIQNLDQLDQLVSKLNAKSIKSDPCYSGYQLFIGVQDLPHIQNQSLDSQQSRSLKYLQYYIYMITNLLADGQPAILQVYSTIYQKSNEYIFLLRWMFNKMTIVKPMLSNHLDHQKFIICEGFRKSAGEKVKKLIVENFSMLKEFGESKLLVKQEVIDKTEYKNFMVEYNNKVLHNEIKRLNDILNQNGNTLVRPHEEFLKQKLKNAYNKGEFVEKIMERIFREKKQIIEEQIKEKQKEMDKQRQRQKQRQISRQREQQMDNSKNNYATPQKPIQQQAPVRKVGLLSILGRKKN